MENTILNLLRSKDEEMQRLGLLSLGYKETRESANEINGELIKYNLQMRWLNILVKPNSIYSIELFKVDNHYNQIFFTNENKVVIVPRGNGIPEVWK